MCVLHKVSESAIHHFQEFSICEHVCRALLLLTEKKLLQQLTAISLAPTIASL